MAEAEVECELEVLMLELAVETFETCCKEVEEEEEKVWTPELLTVRMEEIEDDLLAEEGRTGRSSSTSCGVRETAEEVDTSQRTSERT